MKQYNKPKHFFLIANSTYTYVLMSYISYTLIYWYQTVYKRTCSCTAQQQSSQPTNHPQTNQPTWRKGFRVPGLWSCDQQQAWGPRPSRWLLQMKSICRELRTLLLPCNSQCTGVCWSYWELCPGKANDCPKPPVLCNFTGSETTPHSHCTHEYRMTVVLHQTQQENTDPWSIRVHHWRERDGVWAKQREKWQVRTKSQTHPLDTPGGTGVALNLLNGSSHLFLRVGKELAHTWGPWIAFSPPHPAAFGQLTCQSESHDPQSENPFVQMIMVSRPS